jgi:ribosomal-protein-alanine N-acetyltransferase
VIIETPRLRLTPVVLEDAPDVFLMMRDPEVMAYQDVGEIDDPDLVADIVAAEIRDVAQGLAWYWTMRQLSNGAYVGVCDVSDIDWRHHRAEVGFMLGRGAWGQGYGLEAMQAVIIHAASEGLQRLSARTHAGNGRSQVLLAKLGFEEEGYLRGHVDRDGERRDCRLFGLLL